ncbi:MAG TPA: sigma-54 dependent transcriptional regulator [Syntrophales bacterium]
MYSYRILIVDDDKQLQNSLIHFLSKKYDAFVAGSGEEAIRFLEGNQIDLVMLDIRLPGMDGIETLKEIRERNKEMFVIMMTAYEDVKSVINSMKMGAYDYLVKPLDIEELEIIIERALKNLELEKQIEELQKAYLREFDLDNVVGESEGIKRALAMASKIAKSPDSTVLIQGETGTGKEVIAKMVHYRSGRIGKPFISINCGAIGKDLVESELFGYEKGSFTGGLQEGKKGKIEAADSGTLFLDEISELDPAIQVKLLRFLEEREFYRVGGVEKRKVDIRIIAATNKKLATAVKEGGFREDLYYRLNVANIFLPALRERKEDIIPLTLFFMCKFNKKLGKRFTSVSKEAREIMQSYTWPGNVRELRNCIERILLMEEGSVLEAEHLASIVPVRERQKIPADEIRIPFSGIDLDELIKSYILKALEMSHGNVARAARLLGMSRATISYRMEKYSIINPNSLAR